MGSNVTIVDSTTYDAFPGMVRCPNGDIIVAFSRQISHTASTSAYGVYLTRSTDGGATWSAPVKIVSNDATYEHCSASLSVIGTTIWLTTWRRPTGGGTPITDAIRLHSSTDNGATWSAGTTVDTGTTLAYYAVSESPLVLFGGYYYLGVWGQETSTSGDYSGAVIRSSDLTTWSTVTTFDTGGTSGYNETAVQVVGTTLICQVRNETDGKMRVSTSTDGTTWSALTVSRNFAISAPRASEDINGKAYLLCRYSNYLGATNQAFLGYFQADGIIHEIEPLYDPNPYLYGQGTELADGSLVAAWSTEKSSSDADIMFAKWTIAEPTFPGYVGTKGLHLIKQGATDVDRAYLGTTLVYGSAPPAPTFDSVVLGMTPLRYFRLNETAGASALVDATGTANATVVGSPTFGGSPSGGSNVGGTSVSGWSGANYANTGTPILETPTAFSFMVAIKTTSTATQMAIARDVNTTGTIRQFQLYTSGNVATISVWNSAGSNLARAGTVNVRDGAWHLLCATWDGANVKLYVDGAQDGANLAVTSIRSVTGYGIWIGNEQRTSLPFGGSLDEIAMWDRALSPTEVSNLYASWSAV